eukprot:TRINITY_DN3149_c0_g1_i1.p1 TRINITY_DN3149_c0_g1~~TRINITY_DN3149_c0_g1_i1.p1  ORF type:complete len:695 (+),score=266.68 TRINITY_DN3149_c0_g1_i1:342-2426(+)
MSSIKESKSTEDFNFVVPENQRCDVDELRNLVASSNITDDVFEMDNSETVFQVDDSDSDDESIKSEETISIPPSPVVSTNNTPTLRNPTEGLVANTVRTKRRYWLNELALSGEEEAAFLELTDEQLSILDKKAQGGGSRNEIKEMIIHLVPSSPLSAPSSLLGTSAPTTSYVPMMPTMVKSNPVSVSFSPSVTFSPPPTITDSPPSPLLTRAKGSSLLRSGSEKSVKQKYLNSKAESLLGMEDSSLKRKNSIKNFLKKEPKGLQSSASANSVSGILNASLSRTKSLSNTKKSGLMSSSSDDISTLQQEKKGDFITVQNARLERIPRHLVEDTDSHCDQIKRSRDYWLELGKSYANDSYYVPKIEDMDKFEKFYRIHFFGQKHYHYFGLTDHKVPEQMVISVKEKDETDKSVTCVALIRTQENDDRHEILFETTNTKGISPKKIKAALLHVTGCKKMSRMESSIRFDNDLLKFETKMIVTHQKIGILLRREGQNTEDEMFNNQDGCSPQLDEFLNFLGEKVTLLGHTAFNGGLDVKRNTTGTHSVYTTFQKIELMFHVSTLLPHFPMDPQQVEKKRHIGNDIIVVIFSEASTPFDPSIMRSEYNNVYIFVHPIHEKGKPTHYHISVASKIGTPPFGPLLHYGGVYKKDEQFRNFFLTKLINAERASFEAPSFAPKIRRTRKALLEEFINTYSTKK